MKLSSKHIAFLNFGSFPGTIMFTCGFDYDEVIKISKRKYKNWLPGLNQLSDIFGEENDCAAFASKRIINGTNYLFLCIRKQFDFSDKHQRTLAHEILHIISFNLKDYFDPMDENEAFCYTHSHIMEQCHKILRS